MNFECSICVSLPGDYFVVVQTKEAGKPVLTVVPHQWVSDGFLMWPSKHANVLRKKVTSQPNSSWNKLPCTVKRRYIPTFADAEQEAADLSGQSTEASDSAPRAKKKTNAGTNALKLSNNRFDFNHLIEGNGGSASMISGSPKQPAADVPTNGTIADVGKSHERVFCQPDLSMIMQQQSQAVYDAQQLPKILFQPVDNPFPVENLNSSIPPTSLQEVSPNADNVHAPAGEYIIIQDPAVDGKKIVEDISKKIDSASEKVTEAVVSQFGTMLAGFKSDIDVKLAAALRMQSTGQDVDAGFTFSPVSCILEIQQLEQELEDEHFARKLAMHMKKIVGYTPDNCNGLNVCYSLIDHFFERKLMLQCSWSGGSRGPAPKFAMKSCSNILNTFFEIMHSVNMTFSRTLMEYFFKQITRNSTSLMKAKGLRQPTVHRRGKKVANNVQADENEGQQSRETQPESSSCSDPEREESDDAGEGCSQVYPGEQQESRTSAGFLYMD